jgi:hypothetical protein
MKVMCSKTGNKNIVNESRQAYEQRKIHRKVGKERRRKTGTTQVRLEWAEDRCEGELEGRPAVE